MLEGLVAWVLNIYLGKYVENLNTAQLSIALLQGSVELENLPLKKDAFRHFGLPVHLKYGLIGKIKLKVPVTQLRSAPWIIAVERLTILLKPSSIQEWDEEAEKNAAYEWKLSLLESFEANWKAASCKSTQENSYYASSYYSWFNYGSGLVTKIIENIQLEIKDVHIRYEDNITFDRCFSMGIKIDSLFIQSCNEQWSPGYRCRDPGDEYSFQLLQLCGFSVYMDEIPETQFWDVENLDLEKVATDSHNFILPPVSAEARIKRNRSSDHVHSSKHPRIICDLQLETVSILLTDMQYIMTVSCSKGLERVQRCQKYIRFRPSSTIKKDPKAWWIYCFNCFRYDQRGSIQKYSQWDECLLRARENIAYVKLYIDLLSNSSASSVIDPPLKELKNKVEWGREFEDLRALREVAMSRVESPKNVPLSNSGRSTLFQWFPQWWGWYSSAETTTEETSISNSEDSKINSQLESLEDEILDVIKDSMENNTILRRCQFNFTLKEGNIKLISDSISNENCDCVMELLVDNVRLELESRPVSSSSRFYISLGFIILNDHLTENSIFPVLISPQSSGDAPSGKVNRYLLPTLAKLLPQTVLLTSSNDKPPEPLFQLTYEYKPSRSAFDYKLHIESKSLDVVYNAEALKWLLDFFVKPHQKTDIELKRAAKLHYYSMKQKTKEEFLKNWDNILLGREAAIALIITAKIAAAKIAAAKTITAETAAAETAVAIRAKISSEAAEYSIKHFAISYRVTQTYDSGCCIYFYFVFNYENIEHPVETFDRIEAMAREEILKSGGSLSHHHGIGKIRSQFYRTQVTDYGVDLYKAMKQFVDPQNIFGVGNFLCHM